VLSRRKYNEQEGIEGLQDRSRPVSPPAISPPKAA